MTDERGDFEATRSRLDEILVAVRKKDTSLEQSLELLEEGVRLANMCNELIDQTSWRSADAPDETEQPESDAPPAGEGAETALEGAQADESGSAGADDGAGIVTDEEPEADDPDAAVAEAVPDDERS